MTAFNTRQFFRRVHKQLLAQYFAEAGVTLCVPDSTTGELTPLDVSALEQNQVQPIVDAWSALDDGVREKAETDFVDIDELGDEQGFQVILAQAPYDGLDIADMLAEMDDDIDRAFWVFLNHRQFFDVAFRIRETGRWSQRQWQKRKNFPKRPAETDKPATDRLARALSAYFRTHQTRGRYFDVELLERGGLQYFFAYGEDHARAEQDYEDGQRLRRTHRPAFEVAFLFNPAAGTLDTYAPGGRLVVAELQQIFSREVLGTEIGANEKDDRVYNLEPFQNRSILFAHDPEWGIADVSVVGVRVSMLAKHGTRLTLEAASQADLYDRYDEIVGRWASGGKYGITQATVRVAYHQLDRRRRPKTRTFTVTYPSGCSLKQDDRDLQLRRMLVRSEIDPTGLGLDAARG